MNALQNIKAQYPRAYRWAFGQLFRWLAVTFVITSAAVQASYEEHDHVRRLTQAVETLPPLATIIEICRQRYQSGRILEAELEAEHGRYVYELEAVLDSGQND